MNSEFRSWLVIGRVENWETALSQPIPVWGLKDSFRKQFSALAAGDVIWIYATKPVSGIIGIGLVREKYIDNLKPLWPDELASGTVVWPLRFRFQVLKLLPRDQWATRAVSLEGTGAPCRKGFQVISEKQLKAILAKTQEVFGGSTIEDFVEGPTITPLPESARPQQPLSAGTTLHRNLQAYVAEIGKLQAFYTQTEYPVPLTDGTMNIDVVWKREAGGVPTYAFEVELSGQFERAVFRLKKAHDLWNSRPRLVVPESAQPRIEEIASRNGTDFSAQIGIVSPEKVEQLLSVKRELRSLERELGLY